MITPDTITITIYTQIPGSQVIKYSPNMTVPKSEDKFVLFNPLVKLNEKILQKLPKEIQVSEFFNKGFFISLLRAHGPQEKISLGEAKYEHIIDNNISITLNTLFPEDGIFYIKDQPYTISHMEWDEGNWKIDKKINNLSNVLVTEASIEKEMKSIPEDWLYGDTYEKKPKEQEEEEEKKEEDEERKEEDEEKKEDIPEHSIIPEAIPKATVVDSSLPLQEQAPNIINDVQQTPDKPEEEVLPTSEQPKTSEEIVVEPEPLNNDDEDGIEMKTVIRGGDPQIYNPFQSPFSPYNLHNPNLLHSNSFLQKKDETNFSFHVTITLYLQKGNTISSEQKQHLKCERLKNNIYGDIADIQGKKFEIPPDYNIIKKDKEEPHLEKKQEENEKKGGSRKKNKRTNNKRKTKRRKYKKINKYYI
jgi:hypothetical protein